MENKEKRKDIFIAVLIIIIFILIGLLIVKVCFKKVESIDNPKEQSVQPSNDEQELTDAYIKKDISRKANIMLTMGEDNTDGEIAKFAAPWNLELINFTDKDKLGIVLSANQNNFQKLQASDVMEKVPTIYNKYKNENPDETPERFATDGAMNPYIINGESINKEYKDLFNENPSTYDDHIGECPFYQYDSQTKYYLSSEECGGTNPEVKYLYKYKYTTNDNNLYVYVATLIEMNLKIYKGIKINENNYLYTATSDEQVKSDLKENPQKYEQYRLTFEKNSDGTYYYKTTEKLSA